MKELGTYVSDELYARPYQVRRTTLMDMQGAIRKQPDIPEGRPLVETNEIARRRAIILSGALGDYTIQTAPPIYVQDPWNHVAYRSPQLGDLGFWGKSVAWYEMVTMIENSLLMVNNKVFAIGRTSWNAIYQMIKAGGTGQDILPYDDVQSALVVSIKHFTAPAGGDKENVTDAQISTARQKIDRFGTMANQVLVALAKDQEIQAKVQAEQAKLNQVLSSAPTYRSPQAAYRKELVKQLSERTMGMVSGIADIGKYAVPIGIALAALIFLRK